jgi:hypothetical protein
LKKKRPASFTNKSRTDSLAKKSWERRNEKLEEWKKLEEIQKSGSEKKNKKIYSINVNELPPSLSSFSNFSSISTPGKVESSPHTISSTQQIFSPVVKSNVSERLFQESTLKSKERIEFLKKIREDELGNSGEMKNNLTSIFFFFFFFL